MPLDSTCLPLVLQLHDCLRQADLDRAITLGLMDYVPSGNDNLLDPSRPMLCQELLQTQDRLRKAWAARQRHCQRTQRLARRTAEREARRIAAAPAMPAPSPALALPPLAAAILARAKAKANKHPRA